MQLLRLSSVVLPSVFVICTPLCVKLEARLGCQGLYSVNICKLIMRRCNIPNSVYNNRTYLLYSSAIINVVL